MSELDLHLDSLHIKLLLLDRQVEDANKPYLDWLICEVTVSVPAFSGRFKWNVMPGELKSFADELDAMNEQFPNKKSISFEPAEPNVTLDFELSDSGHIEGRYLLQEDFDCSHVLKGSFFIDQSYLPGISSSINDFLKKALV